MPLSSSELKTIDQRVFSIIQIKMKTIAELSHVLDCEGDIETSIRVARRFDFISSGKYLYTPECSVDEENFN